MYTKRRMKITMEIRNQATAIIPPIILPVLLFVQSPVTGELGKRGPVCNKQLTNYRHNL